MQFSEFSLSPALNRAVADMGFVRPTPIQEQAVPVALTGRDLIGCAQTGTGKTAAFLLPILHRLLETPGRGTRALILTPTRELAAQIDEQVVALARHTKITNVSVFGGVGMPPQQQALRRGVDIVVACPGRLLDHMERGNADFRNLQVLVLDEADRMMDMGFLPDVTRILRQLPRKRQTLLFSATMPEPIRRLAAEFLANPATVEIAAGKGPPQTIRHAIFPVPAHLKFRLLLKLLEIEIPGSGLIFTRTKRGAEKLARMLKQQGYDAGCLHGDRTQGQRTTALERFRDRTSSLLVATDIMQRGIDVDGISHVINYDVPGTPEDYIHRIGRTGRAQAEGEAMTLVTPENEAEVRDIERALGRRLERLWVDEFDYNAVAPPKPPGGGRHGRGKPRGHSGKSGSHGHGHGRPHGGSHRSPGRRHA
jgi:ATP-dependent RNA helicase RhlE